MDSELIAVCVVQIFVLALVVMAIVIYLLRNLMCRSRLDVTGRTLVITGCDSVLGFDLARRYDQLGFRVYAGFINTAGEAAVRLQADASSRLRIIALDVTCTSSLAAAAKLVKEQLPPSEKGQSLLLFLSKTITNKSTVMWWNAPTLLTCYRIHTTRYLIYINTKRSEFFSLFTGTLSNSLNFKPLFAYDFT